MVGVCFGCGVAWFCCVVVLVVLGGFGVRVDHGSQRIVHGVVVEGQAEYRPPIGDTLRLSALSVAGQPGGCRFVSLRMGDASAVVCVEDLLTALGAARFPD